MAIGSPGGGSPSSSSAPWTPRCATSSSGHWWMPEPARPPHARASRARRHRRARWPARRTPRARPIRPARTRRASSADGSRRSSSAGGRPRSGACSPAARGGAFGERGAVADAVVVARSVAPQQGPTSRLLRGFYEGLASSGVPAVGVETSRPPTTAVDAFDKASLSSVDFVDTEVGRFALAVLLAGGRPGSYGLKQTATDGILPPIEAVAAPPFPASGERGADDPHRRTRRGGRIGETIAALRRRACPRRL